MIVSNVGNWLGEWAGDWLGTQGGGDGLRCRITMGFTLTGTATSPGRSAAPASPTHNGQTRPRAVQTNEDFREAVRKSRIRQEDEELMLLVTAFLRVIT